jgi:hypothetical protein
MLKEEPNRKAYTLVVQSFGRESEYRRAVLTIYSFFAFNGTANAVILFTDNAPWFEPYFSEFPVQYVHLSSEKIKSMRGNIDFLHRMKIVEIEEAFELAQANLLYADSDTFFTANSNALMASLSAKHSYMHLNEYTFESLKKWALPAGKTFLAFVQLIEKKEFQLTNSKVKYDTKMCSWNAGVMMLHWEHRKLLKDVFLLTDQFFPETQNHASEQYAFSLILQTNTELKACDEVIYHYWYGVKKTIADDFLNKHLAELIKINQSEKLVKVKNWVEQLPAYFDQHLLSHKDNAIQAFNENNYKKGYSAALKAISKGAWADFKFIKDVLYHTKRNLSSK